MKKHMAKISSFLGCLGGSAKIPNISNLTTIESMLNENFINELIDLFYMTVSHF